MQPPAGPRDIQLYRGRPGEQQLIEFARGSEFFTAWDEQAKRCNIPLHELVRLYAVSQIIDSGMVPEEPAGVYDAVTLSRGPGRSESRVIAAGSVPDTGEKLQVFDVIGEGSAPPSFALEDNLDAGEVSDVFRKIGLISPAGKINSVERNPPGAVEKEHTGRWTVTVNDGGRWLLADEGNALGVYGLDKATRGTTFRLAVLRDEHDGTKMRAYCFPPQTSADDRNWERVRLRPVPDLQRELDAAHAISMDMMLNFPGYLVQLAGDSFRSKGEKPDHLFKTTEIKLEPWEKPGPTALERRQARIPESAKSSEFKEAWLAQAKRLKESKNLAEDDVLGEVVELHAIRHIITNDRDLLRQFKADPRLLLVLRGSRIINMPEDELVRMGVEDMGRWGEISDDVLASLVRPSARGIDTAKLGITGLHTFPVVPGENAAVEAKPKAGLIDGLDIEEYTLKRGMGQVWAALAGQEPKPIPNRPELEGKSFNYADLFTLVSGIKALYKKENGGTDLDDRLALISVGRYLYEQNIRIFGYNPTLVRLVRSDEMNLDQAKTETGDMNQWIGENVRKMTAVLVANPFPVAMEKIVGRCLPNNPGEFEGRCQEMRAAIPSEADQQRLAEALAYVSLGFAIHGGGMKASAQGDSIMVAKTAPKGEPYEILIKQLKEIVIT